MVFFLFVYVLQLSSPPLVRIASTIVFSTVRYHRTVVARDPARLPATASISMNYVQDMDHGRASVNLQLTMTMPSAVHSVH